MKLSYTKAGYFLMGVGMTLTITTIPESTAEDGIVLIFIGGLLELMGRPEEEGRE